MPSIIQDAITSLLGGDTSDDWRGLIRSSTQQAVEDNKAGNRAGANY